MKILITGATGFVGKAIVEDLIENSGKKWEIYTTGSRKPDETEELPRYASVDITNFKDFDKAIDTEKFNAVVHAAGLAHQFRGDSKENFKKVNVSGTKNVLRFAAEKSVEHFVLISTVAVYGSRNTIGEKPKTTIYIDENQTPSPQSEYARSKLEAEKEAIKFCVENKIILTILRLATVIGEDDRGNVSRLIEAIDKRRFVMIGEGENLKTLIHKKDVARACRLILENRSSSSKEAEIFNVAADPVSMKFIVEKIFQNLGKKAPKVFVPNWILTAPLRLLAKFPVTKIKDLDETLIKWSSEEVFSGDKIFEKYSFKMEITVAEALKREVESYKKQKC